MLHRLACSAYQEEYLSSGSHFVHDIQVENSTQHDVYVLQVQALFEDTDLRREVLQNIRASAA